jgi:hypothetical protein
MWLESHSLASLLPLKSVTNLDYRVHLRTQRILNLLEVGGAREQLQIRFDWRPTNQKHEAMPLFWSLKNFAKRAAGAKSSFFTTEENRIHRSGCPQYSIRWYNVFNTTSPSQWGASCTSLVHRSQTHKHTNTDAVHNDSSSSASPRTRACHQELNFILGYVMILGN